MSTALRLGLTGGIGSGKSTVASEWVKWGGALIDADQLARAVTEAGGAAIPSLREEFGPDILNPEGALNRDKMRRLAFEDSGIRARLEAIVHPQVAQAIEQAARVAEAEGARLLVFDIPLLVESARWRRQLHRVLVVDCLEETQIQRVMHRNEWARDDVIKVIRAQASRAQRLRAADVVLFNDGINVAQLAHEVGQIGQQFGL